MAEVWSTLFEKACAAIVGRMSLISGVDLNFDVRQAHPIILERDVVVRTKEITSSLGYLTLPFGEVFVECLDQGPLFVAHMRDCSFHAHWVYVKESWQGATVQYQVASGSDWDESGDGNMIVDFFNFDEKGLIHRMYKKLLNSSSLTETEPEYGEYLYLKKIFEVISAAPNESLMRLRKDHKLKLKKSRTYLAIQDTVLVGLSGIKDKPPNLKGYSEVEMSHRFWKRGHWRDLPSADEVVRLGKDPAGNRGVPGKTWVIPHLVGPDDAPVKIQTHVYKDE